MHHSFLIHEAGQTVLVHFHVTTETCTHTPVNTETQQLSSSATYTTSSLSTLILTGRLNSPLPLPFFSNFLRKLFLLCKHLNTIVDIIYQLHNTFPELSHATSQCGLTVCCLHLHWRSYNCRSGRMELKIWMQWMYCIHILSDGWRCQ